VRIVFFGTGGMFSRAPLAALAGAGHDICAVVVPPPDGLHAAMPVRLLEAPRSLPADMATPAESTSVHAPGFAPYTSLRLAESPQRMSLPVLTVPEEPTVVGMAWARGIPVLEVADVRSGATLEALAALKPDLICVACFPHLLPGALLQVPHRGALNVHPSLLPRYRGPFPLFWVFHDGLEQAGVSVHLMDTGADSGPIVLQEVVRLPDGIGYDQAERHCSDEGARLLVEAARLVATGLAAPRAQERGLVSWAPAPRDDDFVVTPDWPARRAFNFIRGLVDWQQPIYVEVAGRRLRAREALAWDETAPPADSTLSTGGRLTLRCRPGTLTVIVDAP
jgi:methionyl-tRNA formyltransferase